MFRVSGDDFLSYAVDNRKEWEKKGEAVVKEFLDRCLGVDNP
jgi:hypothetical protein